LTEKQPTDRPAQFESGKYRLRAILTKPSAEEPNNLHLLVYSPHRGGATLFENTVTEVKRGFVVEAGEGATFTGEEGHLIPDELPGGLATHHRIFQLMKKLEAKPAFIITTNEVQSADRTCVWTP
jgi:hypothetical protein